MSIPTVICTPFGWDKQVLLPLVIGTNTRPQQSPPPVHIAGRGFYLILYVFFGFTEFLFLYLRSAARCSRNNPACIIRIPVTNGLIQDIRFSF